MAKYLVAVKPGQAEVVMTALGKLGLPATKPVFGHLTVNIPEAMLDRVRSIPGVADVKPDSMSAIRAGYGSSLDPLRISDIAIPAPEPSVSVRSYQPVPIETKFSEWLHRTLSNPFTGPASAFRWLTATDDGKIRTPTSVSRQMIGADQAEAMGITGKGIKIAVLDTGTSYDALFQGAFIGGKSSMPGQPVPWDEVGHGQWCNTCIAGKPMIVKFGPCKGMQLKGVAPEATVAAFKVLGGGLGLGTASSILGGLKNAQEWGADIISMSLGGEEPDDYASDPQCQAITELAQSGIIVVVAAGNSGPGPSTVNNPGCCPDALTVGAVDSTGQMAYFSSRGPTKGGFIKPDVVAPGVDILSTSCGYIAAMHARIDGPPSLSAISGTSMATPHVAGLLALALQYARASRGKGLTTSDIKRAMSYGQQNNDYGWGMITWLILKQYIDERGG